MTDQAADLALRAARALEDEGQHYDCTARVPRNTAAAIIQRIIEPALVAAREERDRALACHDCREHREASAQREAALLKQIEGLTQAAIVNERAHEKVREERDKAQGLLAKLEIQHGCKHDPEAGIAASEYQAAVERFLQEQDARNSLSLVLRRIGSGQCEEQNLARELRCDERMGGVDGWKVEDWCYPCQAREAAKEK